MIQYKPHKAYVTSICIRCSLTTEYGNVGVVKYLLNKEAIINNYHLV